MALFFLMGLLGHSFVLHPASGLTTEWSSLSKPHSQFSASTGIIFETASAASDGISLNNQAFPVATVQGGPLPGAISPESALDPNAFPSNVSIYKVVKGDTLTGIAAYFKISVSTILNANPTLGGGTLSVGEELTIPPTTGSIYVTQDGDTLDSIATAFDISQDTLVQFNNGVDFNLLGPGISIVIPGRSAGSAQNSLPNFNSEFIMPAQGFNWGQIHHYNAVDISNSCGTPVIAAAEGLVVPDDNFADGKGTVNGGYGMFVLIEHPFGDGVYTRYAHLSKILVDIGTYVKQGQEIGLMGQTGEATGCHVHFEVYGAQNPFGK